MDAKKKQRLNRATRSGAERHNYTRQKTKNLEETNLPHKAEINSLPERWWPPEEHTAFQKQRTLPA